ncbi:MAG: reverse transcriptase family protein [Bacteroidales bacterium]|nr:reverse transcriptase family protein [Bacteroidales bacterium]
MKKKELNNIMLQWERFYAEKGIGSDVQSLYLEYVKNLLSKDLPPIFDFHHLCLMLGIKDEVVAAMVSGTESFYRSFSIPKKKGGSRDISAPYPSLKHAQLWIYHNILKKLKTHGCAHGFIPNRSIITNVQTHLPNRILLKIDLKDFFSTIRIEWIIQVFKSLGYEHHVAFYLASLCCCNGSLPQGAPTSPVLSNLTSIHLDRRLFRLAKKYHLAYTRYADDIAFSGNTIPVKFIEYVKSIIEDCGLEVNNNKVRLYNENGSKILTGICLSNGEARLPREKRRELEKELHYIEKFGLDGHIRHSKIKDAHYLESLIGRVGFWLQVEPDNLYAQKMKVMLYSEKQRRSILK